MILWLNPPLDQIWLEVGHVTDDVIPDDSQSILVHRLNATGVSSEGMPQIVGIVEVLHAVSFANVFEMCDEETMVVSS